MCNKRIIAVTLAVCMILGGCSKIVKNDERNGEQNRDEPNKPVVITPAPETEMLTDTETETPILPITETTEDVTTETAIEITEEITEIIIETTTQTEPQTTIETTIETTTQPTQTTTQPPITTTQPPVTTTQPPQTTPNSITPNYYKTLNFSEQKGIWFTYLEFQHMLKNKTKSQFTDDIGKAFDNAASIGINTVYVHVRAFGDSYYKSSLFPTTDNYNGTYGVSAPFDPLEIMVKEAHDRGLSIHAMVNPMRLMTDSQIKSVPDNYLIKQWYNTSAYKGKYIVLHDGRWYLNIAYPDVAKLIADGVAEILQNYNVDGVQIDDYFYPTTATSFDSSAYSSSNTSLNLSNWRIANVNSLVKRLYNTVHAANSTAVFGVSPQGSVSNNYNHVYADVRTWCTNSGYCDYILPQVYFGFDNETLPYETVCKEWQGMTKSGDVKLVFGLAAYKVGLSDNYAGTGKNEWLNNSDVISRQVKYAKTLNKYGGYALFRYDSLFEPVSGVKSTADKELSKLTG